MFCFKDFGIWFHILYLLRKCHTKHPNTTLSFKFIVSVTTRCLSEAKAANLSERAKAGRACA